MTEQTSQSYRSRDETGKKSTIVEFAPNDTGNPRNWPRWKKYSVIAPLLLVDLTVSFGASGKNDKCVLS